MVAGDFDGNGTMDIYTVQNFYTREPETGLWRGDVSLLIESDPQGQLHLVDPAQSGLVVDGDAKSVAVTDINNDGRPDIIVTQNDDQLLVFKNNDPNSDRCFAVKLVGPNGNPTGIGAKVMVTLPDNHSQTQGIYAGGGYLSQSSPTLYFGTAGKKIKSVSIRWPDGKQSEIQSPAGKKLSVKYADSIAMKTRLYHYRCP